MDYIIKKTNAFNNAILGEQVGAFASFPLACEYVDLMAAKKAESYVVTFKGEIVYPKD